ncbi:hypothetical protein [Flavimaricola marinus]|uniref:Uncharacterized protein n=1 Tax=Flavimaricola marinus TaxID=1819565 RepID=A0A238LC39_9RHOB|nr:hypothetical protein [Flavimaricola marinus]SMY07287.1 hypothetical protein LOM8899_01420 [Flavimaricola marinus]
MSDLQTLRKQIRRLSEPAESSIGQARVLANDNCTDIAAAMRQAIEDTQLPRVLCFENERNGLLSLHVRSGRMVTILDATVGNDFDKGAIHCELSERNEGQIEQVGRLVAALLHGARRLLVTSSLDVPDMSQAVLGIAAADVFQDRANQNEGSSAEYDRPKISVILDRLKTDDVSWLWFRGKDVRGSDGDPSLISRLQVLALKELDDRASLPQVDPSSKIDDDCLVLFAGGDGTETILSASLGEDLLFISFPSCGLTDVLKVWRDILH